MGKSKSNWSTVSGIDDAVFYTGLYMTIATLLQILVCFLAARDTYKRVKSKERKPNTKWPSLKKKTQSMAIEEVNRTMREACSSIQSISAKPTSTDDSRTIDTSEQSANEPSPLILTPSKENAPTTLMALSAISISPHSPSKSNITTSPLSIASGPSVGTPIELMETNTLDKLPRLNSPGAIFCFFSVGMGRRWHIYSPLILHFWDSSTDIGVIIDWLQVADVTGFWEKEVTSLWYASLAILSMLIYRIISGIGCWRTLGWKSGIAQMFDVLVYREVYEAYVDEKIRPTMHFRWIRKMEAIFEAFPQCLIQTVWILKTSGEATPLMVTSILMSVVSISLSIIKDDEWKFGGKDSNFRKKCPPHPKFLLRSFFRISEVLARLATMSLLWLETTGYYLVAWSMYQMVFYFQLYKEKKLGRDPGNFFAVVIGYPNLSYRDNDYRNMSLNIKLFGILTLWTPFAYICKKWDNVTIFYAARFSENLIILGGCLILQRLYKCKKNEVVFCGDIFFFGAFIMALFCNIFMIHTYFNKIKKYLGAMESGLNLDIWGVLKQSVEDIDLLRRFIKRAPTTINKIRESNGANTLMEASKQSDIYVLLCILHGDVYYSLKDSINDRNDIEKYNYNKYQRMLAFKRKKESDKWIAPNGFKRDNNGKSVIYYLIKQYIINRETIYKNNLYKQGKDFKRRQKWLYVLINHIAYNPPIQIGSDLHEYLRTAFVLEFISENNYLQIQSMEIMDRATSDSRVTKMFSGHGGGNLSGDEIEPIYDTKLNNKKHKRSQTVEIKPIASKVKANKNRMSIDIAVNKLNKQFSDSSTMATPVPTNINPMLIGTTKGISIPEPETLSEMDSMENAMGQFGKISKSLTQRGNDDNIMNLIKLKPIENQQIFINLSDLNGLTALHWATKENSNDFIHLLLEYGANPNLKDYKMGETPMHMAIRLDKSEIISAFIDWNYKINQLENDESIIKPIKCDWYSKDNIGSNVIFSCINYNKSEILNELYESGDVNVEIFDDEEQNTILQWALKMRKNECVKSIILNDMLTDKLLIHKNKQNKSALYFAILTQNNQIVKLLIEHFINKLNQKLNNEIIYCLNQCIKLKFLNVLKVFFEFCKDLILQNENKCHEMLKNIIEKHNSDMLNIFAVYFQECLTIKNENNENILFYCIEYDKPKLLKLLINQYKCNVNIQNKNGMDLIKYCDHFDRPTCKHHILQLTKNTMKDSTSFKE